MKKILIFSHGMEIGGAERALLGLLEVIDTTKYQVDLFLMRHEGDLLKYIPDTINLIPEILQYTCLAVPISDVLKKRQIPVAVGRFKGKVRAQFREKELHLTDGSSIALDYSHKYTVNAMPYISHIEYDLAISFLTPHYFVIEKVRAKKKIAWIHTDYSGVKIDTQSELLMWDKYDNIVSISDDVTSAFLSVFPTLKPKVQLIANILPSKCIQKLMNAFTVNKEMPNDGTTKLLSIGRFCESKNFDNIPYICKNILDYGLNIKWYLIGYGKDEALIRKKIHETNMEEYIHILGKKENPYPYIRACDIYVQPSKYEGKCVSVIEAQFLNKPVIITNYATSRAQLIDGYDGIIVPIENEKCAEGIAKVIKDKELQRKFIENENEVDYTNEDEINKIYRLID